MTSNISTKLRMIGGASTIAMTMGMAPAAFAQAAPEGCNQDGTNVVCTPDVDPDGFQSADDGLTLTVEIDALVQGEINLALDSNVTVDGDVVVGTGQSALDLGARATVVNNGLLQANPIVDAIISVEEDSLVTNNGTISAESALLVAGINVEANSTVVNNGTIELSGNQVVGIVGGLTLDETGITVTNSSTGRILIDGRPDGLGFGILLNDQATVVNEGVIETLGDDSLAILVGANSSVTNRGMISTTGIGSSGITTEDNGAVVNEAGGTISTAGTTAFGILVGTDSTVENAGTITTRGGNAAGVRFGDNSSLTNSGSITTAGQGAEVIVGATNATIVNSGTIASTGNFARGIEVGEGFVLTNSGVIDTVGQAVTTTQGATITNSGIIRSGEDAGIEFASGAITNEEGGSISGAVGVASAAGATGSQTVANFGAIEGTAVDAGTGRADAVVFGDGNDEFQQWTGATATGWVDLGMGDDTFILEGSSSSITGFVDGGAGTDTAILSGTLDGDNLVGFEAFQLGSQLGGTLNDLDINGNRTLEGDVVHTGVVNVDLGVDSLTATGSITLEETGVLNIATPLNEQLLDQEVLILQEGTTFTNNGATVNILDDDLLLDYTLIAGSLSVGVTAANPLVGSSDENLVGIGEAVSAGIAAGTLGGDTFATLNSLPDADAYSAALSSALPSLSDGVGREIFESGSLASQALDHHIADEGSGVWGQIAVRGAEQDALSSTADGYESDQLVFTVGGDMPLGDNIRVGLIASYADIEVQDETGSGAVTNTSDIESIRLGAYGAATFADRGFLNAELSYLTGDVDASRGSAFGSIASSYDFDGWAARTVIGYDLLPDENVWITPSVGVNAAEISFDDATEAGGFGFLVERGDATFIESRFGVEVGAQVSDQVNGFIQGTVIHDLMDDTRSFRLSSAALPTFTVALPQREQDRFELSAGASIDVDTNVAIDVGYLGEFNDGYDAHSARASVRVAF